MSKICRYIWILGGTGGGRTFSTVHFLFIIKKTEKVQEHDLYLNQILHHFDLIFFCRIDNKNFMKSEHSSSNWFHSNTPNSRHIFNTNMYLIHFYSKSNIKIHIPKSYVLKFQNRYQRSIFISEEKNKNILLRIVCTTTLQSQVFKKNLMEM